MNVVYIIQQLNFFNMKLVLYIFLLSILFVYVFKHDVYTPIRNDSNVYIEVRIWQDSKLLETHVMAPGTKFVSKIKQYSLLDYNRKQSLVQFRILNKYCQEFKSTKIIYNYPYFEYYIKDDLLKEHKLIGLKSVNFTFQLELYYA